MVLGLIALAIAAESVMRLFEPVAVAFVEATWIAVLGLAVNIASVFLLAGNPGHGHHHDHHGHEHGTRSQDNSLRAAYVHVLADALTSILAIVALLAGRYLGWVWLDPVMGIVGGVVIGRWSWVLMRDTAAVLLDTTDAHVADEVRDAVEGPGDARIVDLHVWRIGPEAHAGIVSVAGTPGLDADAIRARLAPVHELVHLTVEFTTMKSPI